MSRDMEEVARALPDYEIRGELGRGEFGIVWGGRHRQLGREVAIKQLSQGSTSTAEHRARFRREARILAHVDHPHVVRVYDYREHEDLRLLVMELLPGGTLGDRRNAGITLEGAIASTLAAASGLHCAHEQGVLHRDVKPENLMFDRRSTLEVTDFGIARLDLVDATVLNVTHAGEFFGTPAYVAPEQAAQALSEGWPAIGTAADQYSLAAVLYEMLSGRLTHDASGGALALCTRRMNEEARSLRDAAPGIPSGIEAVVMRALARDPAARHPSMEVFGVELATASATAFGADWLTRSEVQIREAGAILDAALGGRALPPPPPPPVLPLEPVPRRRRRTGVMVLVGIAILLLALGSFFLLTRGASDSPSARGKAPAGDAASTLALTKAWVFPTGGVVFSSPAVAGGAVLVGSDDGSVYGIDAATGAQRWKYASGGPIRSSPAVDGDRVFVGSDDGTLYALDRATGAVLWSRPVGFEIVSSPVVGGGAVIVGADRLYAFDEVTGSPRWTFAPGDTIVSSPAISGDTVVVGSNDRNVYGVALSDGAERWHLPTGGAVQSSPIAAGDDAYVGDLDGYLYSVVASTGVRRWATNLGSPVKSSPTVSEGTVYVGTDAGRLVAVNAAHGTVRWTFGAPDRIDSSPVVVGQVVVVGSDDGNVYAVDARTGAQRGAFKTGGPVLSSPQAAGGGVVVGSNDGSVYKIIGFGAPR